MVEATQRARLLNSSCLCAGADLGALHTVLQGELSALAAPIPQTHPHLFSAAAVFVSQAQIDQMRRVIRAIESVVATPAYQQRMLATAPEIAKKNPGNRGVFFGYDFHLCESGPKLIEINTNAGGAMLNIALRRAQRACCDEFDSLFESQRMPESLERSIVDMFVREWGAARGNQELHSIAIVDDAPQGQYLYPEFLLIQQLLEKHGFAVMIVDPSEMQYRQRRLFAKDRAIDLVYNRCTDFYFEEARHAELARAYRDGAAVVTPHPHAHALYANKRNLITLSDEGELRALEIPKETIDVLRKGIPLTQHVTWSDAELWWANRKNWFFKPMKGFGSRGSYRGDKLTRKVFADILCGEYIAQQIAKPSERRVTCGATERTLKMDVRNYVYQGETQLLGVRLYSGQTTNFRSEGGGFAPLLTPRDGPT